VTDDVGEEPDIEPVDDELEDEALEEQHAV
jgi:hypothetical protein